MVHVFADGFAVEDGPKHSFTELGNAVAWVQTDMHARANGAVAAI